MKKLLFLFIACLISHFAFLQKLPEIEVNPPKSKGKAKIYYRLKDKFVYFPNTKLIDWSNSLMKLEVSEKFDPKKKYFVEQCKYADGKKQGEFSFSQFLLKEFQSNYGNAYYTGIGEDIIKGNYVNDQINGKIDFLTFIDSDNNEGFVSLDYENGRIKDQILQYPTPISNGQYGNLKFTLVPKIAFKNGIVSEVLMLEKNGLPYYYIYNGNKSIRCLKYTLKPACYNDFSFLESKDEGKNLIDLNTNNLSIEHYNAIYDDSKKKYKIEGSYRLFAISDNLFDTTKLVAEYNYLEGKRNGTAKIWDVNKNGHNGDLPMIISTFKDDLLDGSSQFMYADGKVAVQANFIKGFPIGEAISFYNSPNFKVFDLKSLVPRWIDNGGILMIYHIGKFSDSDTENIKTIRSKGGKISDLNGYGIYCKINYKLDSMQTNGVWYKGSVASSDFALYNNGKVMVDFLINKEKLGEYRNIIYKDESGKEVYSLKEAQKEVEDVLQKKLNEIEKQNNNLITCQWCNKQIKYGNRVETDECHCFERSSGKNSSVLHFKPKVFCSNDCRAKHEKDCCISNGKGHE